MARSMTAVAFDETEVQILKEVNDSKRISALTKPLTDEIRAMSRTTAELAKNNWVERESLENAAQDIQRHRAVVEGLPETHEREEHLEALRVAEDVINGALKLQ